MSDQNPDLPTPPRLSGLGGIALFLDLDGTLAAIESRPEDVKPEPWRTALLKALLDRLDGRLAIVSGRSLEEVDRILEHAVCAVAAVHGQVRRRQDDCVITPAIHPAMSRARHRITALVQAHKGLQLEDKQFSLAVHDRAAPAAAALVREEMEAIARGGNLKLQLGDMVGEILAPGFDKGAALAAFMTEPPFEGSWPVFVGDDLTDEDGFRAAEALAGFGVLVGSWRPTQASRRLAGAPAVRSWLEETVTEDAPR